MKYAKRYMAKIGSAGILLTALAATACMDHGDDIPLIELGAVCLLYTSPSPRDA